MLFYFLDESQENQTISAILICTSKFSASNSKQVLAFISGAAVNDAVVKDQTLESLIDSSLKSCDLKSDKVGLIVTSAPLEMASEITNPKDLDCSLSFKK